MERLFVFGAAATHRIALQAFEYVYMLLRQPNVDSLRLSRRIHRQIDGLNSSEFDMRTGLV